MSGAYDLEELEDYLQNPNKTATSAAMQYVAALKKVLEEGGQLSPGQKKAFRAIKTEKLSAEERYNKWKESYTPEMKEKVRIMSGYYIEALHESRLSSYERQNMVPIAEVALREEDWVPSKELYDRLCESAIAKKVLHEHHAEPKFSVGDLIAMTQRGKEFMPGTRNALASGGYVIGVNAKPISSPSKGSKWYLVLPVGGTKPCLVQEKWLKKGKPY